MTKKISESTRKVRRGKAKGRRLQKQIANKVSEITGCEIGKDKEIESREMGQSGTDIKLYGKAKELFPFAVECKNTERWCIGNYIKQAKSNYNDSFNDWLLFVGKSRFPSVVIMRTELFSLIKNKTAFNCWNIKKKRFELSKLIYAIRKKVKNNNWIISFISSSGEKCICIDTDMFFLLYSKKIGGKKNEKCI